MGGPAVSARGLRKSYGDVHALRGIDLEVASGECVALLGPNGAGKTVTVEILEGFRNRDDGEVRVLGVDPAVGGLAWHARIGIVLQTVADLKELRVLEAIRHFARYFPSPADPDEVVDSVGLTDKRTARIADLSGGQRRRLDVALGIIGNPELLFLDEPTTGFDPEARHHFWTMIDGLKERGVTILLTTHYLDEAERLADRVTVISRGRVVADQTPSSLRAEATRTTQVTWLEDGARRSVTTHEPTAVLRGLTARFAGEIPEISVVRPSLEDAYLQLLDDDNHASP